MCRIKPLGRLHCCALAVLWNEPERAKAKLDDRGRRNIVLTHIPNGMKGSLSRKPTRTSVGRPMTTAINGLRYHWCEAGGGPLLLLLHGGAAHSGWFRWMMPRLATRYRVVAPDLRGNGRTGHAERYTWDDYAADIEALVNLLVGNRPYYLAGHCSGGYIGMLIAARGRRPPAALVGMEVLPPPARAPTGSQLGLRASRAEALPDARGPRPRPPGLRSTPGPPARPRRGTRARALPSRSARRLLGAAI